jgi:uncharacterized protein YidB (DUF937 family)
MNGNYPRAGASRIIFPFPDSTRGENMFEVLTREAAVRFGVGSKALPLTQALLAAMMAKDTGGLAGFLEKFKAAGLEPLVQSWLGGGQGAQPISNAQIESVLGTSGGLLSALTAHLDLPRDKVTEAIGYLLPALIGRLTPGGNLPTHPPADIAGHAQIGQDLLAQAIQAVQAAQQAGAAGNSPKWLTWAVAIVAVLGALYAWSTGTSHLETSQPIATPGSSPPKLPANNVQPPPSGAAFGGSGAPVSKPASAAAPAIAAASAALTASGASAAAGAAAANRPDPPPHP